MPIYHQPDHTRHRSHSRSAINAIKNYMNRNKPDLNDPINRIDKSFVGPNVQTAAQATAQADPADIPRQPVNERIMIDLVTNQFVTKPYYSNSDSEAISVSPIGGMSTAVEYVSDIDDSEDENYYVFSSRGLRYGSPVHMHNTHKSSRSNSEHSRQRPSFETMAAAMTNRSSSQPPVRAPRSRLSHTVLQTSSGVSRTNSLKSMSQVSSRSSQTPVDNHYVVASHYQSHQIDNTGCQQHQPQDVKYVQQLQFSQTTQVPKFSLPEPFLKLIAPLTRHIRAFTPRQDLRAIIFAFELLTAVMVVNWINNNSGMVLLVSAIVLGFVFAGRNTINSPQR